MCWVRCAQKIGAICVRHTHRCEQAGHSESKLGSSAPSGLLQCLEGSGVANIV